MKTYNEFRVSLLGAVKAYQQSYQKIPEACSEYCAQIREIIIDHDDEQKAYELKKKILNYTSGITYGVFYFLPWNTQATKIHMYMTLVCNREEFSDLNLAINQRDEYADLLQAEREATDARSSVQRQQLLATIKQKEHDLVRANNEITRLQDENAFLVEVIQFAEMGATLSPQCVVGNTKTTDTPQEGNDALSQYQQLLAVVCAQTRQAVNVKPNENSSGASGGLAQQPSLGFFRNGAVPERNQGDEKRSRSSGCVASSKGADDRGLK